MKPKNKSKKESKLEELERRIALLESQRTITYVPSLPPHQLYQHPPTITGKYLVTLIHVCGANLTFNTK